MSICVLFLRRSRFTHVFDFYTYYACTQFACSLAASSSPIHSLRSAVFFSRNPRRRTKDVSLGKHSIPGHRINWGRAKATKDDQKQNFSSTQQAKWVLIEKLKPKQQQKQQSFAGIELCMGEEKKKANLDYVEDPIV